MEACSNLWEILPEKESLQTEKQSLEKKDKWSEMLLECLDPTVPEAPWTMELTLPLG